jgi:hypothetical protein
MFSCALTIDITKLHHTDSPGVHVTGFVLWWQRRGCHMPRGGGGILYNMIHVNILTVDPYWQAGIVGHY